MIVINTIKENNFFKSRNIFIILLIIAIAIIPVYLFSTHQPQSRLPGTSVKIADSSGNVHNLSLETARSFDEQKKGLMFRASMGQDEGMIFVFNNATKQSFWMKDTLIPLDIIFINEYGKILNIEEAPVCEGKCPSYYSKGEAKYVIEMNLGWSKKNNIKAGDMVEINT